MKALPAAIPPLLIVALLAMLAPPASAQKSVIQRSRGSEAGMSSGASRGGRLHSIRVPSSGISQRGSAMSRGLRDRAPSLSRGFPVYGRGEPQSSLGRPLTTLSPGFPLRGRGGEREIAPVPTRRSSSGRLHGAASGSPAHEKKFLSLRDRSRPGLRHLRDDSHRRRFVRDRTTFVFFDPFFFAGPFFIADPFFFRGPFFLRSPFLFSDGFFVGRSRFFRPSFFHLSLGWPGVIDPWPAFWSFGPYDYGLPYGPGRYRSYERRHGANFDSAYDYGESYDEGAASPRYEEGRRALAFADYESAALAFGEYVRENPRDPLGHLSLGVAMTALGHYGKAADAFRRGLEASPEGRRPYMDLPGMFGSRSEFRRVQGELEDYVRSHADNQDARFDLGVLYFFSGELDAARALLGGLGDDRHARYLLEDMI